MIRYWIRRGLVDEVKDEGLEDSEANLCSAPTKN